VLYKPSEFSTLTGLAIADLLYRSGVPEEVFAPVVGAGPTGAALLEQDVNGVYFTGSYATGRRIAETVAGRLIRVQLELGGKDPAYICDDVDVAAAAAAAAEGAFYNAGQSCCAVERVYVHRAIADEFTDAFVEAVRGYRVGDPADEETYARSRGRRSSGCCGSRWTTPSATARSSSPAGARARGRGGSGSRRCSPAPRTR
jgi:acyl-CoA reductase-like NAD-dependent aldehyde dehydrogenase